MIDRLLDDLRAIVRETFPRLAYLGTYEYVIFEASAPTYNLKPTDPKAGLPPLPNVRLKPGIPGLTTAMVVGAFVYVTFADSDPARPIILAVSGPDDDDGGFTPTSIALDAGEILLGGAGGRVLRDGEAVRVQVTGAIVAGGSGSIDALGTITINPLVEVLEGDPGVGFSKVKA